jgi:hypothetical protein
MAKVGLLGKNEKMIQKERKGGMATLTTATALSHPVSRIAILGG